MEQVWIVHEYTKGDDLWRSCVVFKTAISAFTFARGEEIANVEYYHEITKHTVR